MTGVEKGLTLFFSIALAIFFSIFTRLVKMHLCISGLKQPSVFGFSSVNYDYSLRLVSQVIKLLRHNAFLRNDLKKLLCLFVV